VLQDRPRSLIRHISENDERIRVERLGTESQ
jgi:hypothetical protein